jgi:hypothetical protein
MCSRVCVLLAIGVALMYAMRIGEPMAQSPPRPEGLWQRIDEALRRMSEWQKERQQWCECVKFATRMLTRRRKSRSWLQQTLAEDLYLTQLLK